jgi:hypothetical protein
MSISSRSRSRGKARYLCHAVFVREDRILDMLSLTTALIRGFCFIISICELGLSFTCLVIPCTARHSQDLDILRKRNGGSVWRFAGCGEQLVEGDMGSLVCVRDECVCMVMVLGRPRVFALCV